MAGDAEGNRLRTSGPLAPWPRVESLTCQGMEEAGTAHLTMAGELHCLTPTLTSHSFPLVEALAGARVQATYHGPRAGGLAGCLTLLTGQRGPPTPPRGLSRMVTLIWRRTP